MLVVCPSFACEVPNTALLTSRRKRNPRGHPRSNGRNFHIVDQRSIRIINAEVCQEKQDKILTTFQGSFLIGEEKDNVISNITSE